MQGGKTVCLASGHGTSATAHASVGSPCPRGSGTGGEPLSPGAPAGQPAGNEGRGEKATGPASVGGEDQSPGDMNGQPRGRVCWLQVAPGERGCS